MASRLSGNTAESAWTTGRDVTNPLHSKVTGLFLERRHEIYAYLVTLGIRPDEAQELTNDAFLKYYVALRDGQSIANPRAWVYTVAHNLAMNRHTETEAVELPVELPGFDRQTPESIALENERLAKLHRAVENLSPQQRSCLHLRAEGLLYREIAGIIGINPSTVGELLQRAVKRLRKALYE
jgi:RNA polymerase sigma-70 factor, ECF subfamily